MLQRHISLTLASALLMLAEPLVQAQMQHCEVNGKDVNPSNGYTTADKTGIMRCKGEDGKLRREEEIRAGKFIGLRRFYNDDGSYNESTINEQGNRHGRYREFFPGNKLKADEQYDNGSSHGLGKRFFDNGQLQRIGFSDKGKEIAAIEYQKDGKLARVRCASQSLFPEDKAVCGFGGKASDLSLYNSRGQLVAKEVWLAGVMASRSELNDGVPTRSVSFANNVRTTRSYFKDGKLHEESVMNDAGGERNRQGQDGVEKEWAANGQLIREVSWKDGLQTRQTQWYMNGNLREKLQNDGAGAKRLTQVERYWDNGKVQTRETQRGRSVVGISQHFDEEGHLRREELYDDKSVLKTRKEYDASGKLLKDEEFFEDGSRKRH